MMGSRSGCKVQIDNDSWKFLTSKHPCCWGYSSGIFRMPVGPSGVGFETLYSPYLGQSCLHPSYLDASWTALQEVFWQGLWGMQTSETLLFAKVRVSEQGLNKSKTRTCVFLGRRRTNYSAQPPQCASGSTLAAMLDQNDASQQDVILPGSRWAVDRLKVISSYRQSENHWR